MYTFSGRLFFLVSLGDVVILLTLPTLVTPDGLVILDSLFILLSIVSIVSLVILTYPGGIAIPLTSMSSVDRKTRHTRTSRLAITISTSWLTMMEGLYRQTISTRLN